MSFYGRYGKRCFDFCWALLWVVILSPIMFLAALAIWIEDRHSPIFRQQRIGREGTSFTLTKFRSMPVNTSHVPSSQATTLRVTTVGKFIRRSNIDELPQLFNIVRGDMSVVGPRPALPSQTSLIELRSAAGALAVRPGLTGLAQINSYDGMPESEKAKFDGQYARSVSLAGDFMIILKTFGYLTRRPPVY